MTERDDSLEPSLPPAMAAEVHRLYTTPPPADAFDAALLAHARAEIAHARRRRLFVMASGPVAAAACVALAAVVLWPHAKPASPSRELAALAEPRAETADDAGVFKARTKEGAALDPADLNADGVIDIIDALILANDAPKGRGLDVNHDGRVDRADADALAVRAVRLDGGAS